MLDTNFEASPISFLLFLFFAGITVLGAGGVAFFRNIVYSAFALLAAFAGVVGLFAFMSADFLAVVQLMVYVGGILVLILFAVMLTNRISDVKHSNPSNNRPLGLLAFAGVLAVLLIALLGHDWPTIAEPPHAPTAAVIGDAFLSEYLLPFEIAGIMLLAALLAAVVVARKEIKGVPETGNGAQESEGAQS